MFNINLLEYNNFEAGEGKTALDTHFAHTSHKIVRYVRVGNDLETGEELAQLVQVNDTHDKNSVRSHLQSPTKVLACSSTFAVSVKEIHQFALSLNSVLFIVMKLSLIVSSIVWGRGEGVPSLFL